MGEERWGGNTVASCPSEQCGVTEYPGAHPDLKIHTYGSRSTGVTHEAYWQEIPGLQKKSLPHLMFLAQRWSRSWLYRTCTIANSSPMSVIRPRRSTRKNSPPGFKDLTTNFEVFWSISISRLCYVYVAVFISGICSMWSMGVRLFKTLRKAS